MFQLSAKTDISDMEFVALLRVCFLTESHLSRAARQPVLLSLFDITTTPQDERTRAHSSPAVLPRTGLREIASKPLEVVMWIHICCSLFL